jgi:hypothetical protein
MNDFNHNTTSPERQVPPPVISRRLQVVSVGQALVGRAAENTPEDMSVRDYYQPSHLASPVAQQAAVVATEQVMSKVVEFPVRPQSLPTNARQIVNAMPLPPQTGEVIDMDQYRRAQLAREQINAA